MEHNLAAYSTKGTARHIMNHSNYLYKHFSVGWKTTIGIEAILYARTFDPSNHTLSSLDISSAANFWTLQMFLVVKDNSIIYRSRYQQKDNGKASWKDIFSS